MNKEKRMSRLLKEIEVRQAKRALSGQTIPEEVVSRIMTAATYAPSCYNNQPWRFLVVTEEKALEKVRSVLTGGNYWAKMAPLLIAVATKKTLDAQLSDGREYALFGCGLATENLLLQATKEGLYAHPMAGFDPVEIKKTFSVPQDYIVICLIAVGYPGPAEHLSEKHAVQEKSSRIRKPEAEVICRNVWTFD
jgi:glutaredoxin-dependent peroxiredoxin